MNKTLLFVFIGLLHTFNALECDRDLLNLGAEIFFKNPEHKRLGRHILSSYGKWVTDGFEAFDQKIEDLSLDSQRIIYKAVNTTLQPMFVEYLMGEFVCNTIDMVSPKCQVVKDLPNDEALDKSMTDSVSRYYFVSGLKKFKINENQYRWDKNEARIPGLHHKIPKIVNYVWATSPAYTKQVSEKSFQIMQNNLETIQKFTGDIKFILWVNDRNLLQPSIQRAESLGVTVKSFSELPSWNLIEKDINRSVRMLLYGVITDVMRYSILNDFGGAYLDLDYIIVNDISIFFTYDLFVMDLALGTASSFMGSTINHPAQESALLMGLHSLENQNRILDHPAACYGRCNHGFHTVGPSIFKFSYYNNANRETDDVQINDRIAENGECKQINHCPNWNSWKRFKSGKEHDHKDFNKELLDDNYCTGYSLGHHTATGGSWCIGF